MRFGVILFLGLLFSPLICGAETYSVGEETDEDVITIYGNACEKFKDDESKASSRVRVTDKASFIAVSDLPDLSDLKDKMSEHDFNVMIYNIMDNYVEDMAVRTSKQDSANICVEITGFISRDNLLDAIMNSQVTSPREEPKVEVKKEPEPVAAPVEEVKKALVYIAPTEFYNGTKSENYAELVRNKFINNSLFGMTANEEDAKYVIVPKVLRAKVEAINDDTNRMQMVAAIELKIPETKASVSEHQNKFVLFTSDEDEQKVAFELMKDLFEKASNPILAKVESQEKKNQDLIKAPNLNIITPNGEI